jgi:hypothetical protein
MVVDDGDVCPAVDVLAYLSHRTAAIGSDDLVRPDVRDPARGSFP